LSIGEPEFIGGCILSAGADGKNPFVLRRKGALHKRRIYA